MKTLRLFTLAAALAHFTTNVSAQQYRMPQDNWYYNGISITGNFGAITIGPDDNIYVATNDSAVAVFMTNGVFVRQFGSGMSISGIAVSSETNVYVLDNAGANHVKKFNATGTLLLEFGAHGSGNTQLNPGAGYSLLAVGKEDRVYVGDAVNRRVQMYDKNGAHLGHWGESNDSDTGGVPFRFNILEGLATLPNGYVCVRNHGGYQLTTNNEFQLFDADGAFVTIKPLGAIILTDGTVARSISTTKDGLLWFFGSLPAASQTPVDRFYHVYAGDGSGSSGLNSSSEAVVRGVPFFVNIGDIRHGGFDRSGTLWKTTSFALFGARRIYGIDAGLQPSALPQPTMLSVRQRPNTSLVDIDYRVVDADDTEVATAILAFVNNGNDFSSLHKPTLFVENTGTNVGPNIPANVVRRVTWDVSELATNFVNLQFEALAKDGRGLLAFNFITIPAMQSQPSFTMSRSGVSDNDLLTIWYWLIGTNSPAITLSNGTIKGVGGSYHGQTLAAGSGTTSQGRQYLYGLLGVRSPTTAEITRAQSGNYGFLSVDANNAVKVP